MKSALAMIVAVNLLVAGCGGSAPAPSKTTSPPVGTATPAPSKTTSPPAGTATYWSIGRTHGTQVLELVKSPGGYLVAWNGGRPHAPLARRGSALVMSRGHTFDTGNGSGVSSPGVELIPKGARLILVTRDPDMGSIDERDNLVHLSRRAYLRALAYYREETARDWTNELSGVLDAWATQHGSYPQPGELQPGSAFGRLVAKWLLRGDPPQMRKTQPAWPFNPYTDEPMSAGTQPGTFTYRLTGAGYTLAVHFGDGRDYVVHSK